MANSSNISLRLNVENGDYMIVWGMYDVKHSGSEVSNCWLYLLITWGYLIYKTGWITAQKCDVSICRQYFGMSGVRPCVLAGGGRAEGTQQRGPSRTQGPVTQANVDAAIQKRSRHPSVIKIKEHLSKPSRFTFCPVSQDDISRKLKSIDIKKGHWVW